MIWKVERLVWKQAIVKNVSSKWASIKLLEGDGLVRETLDLSEETIRRIDRISQVYDMESIIAGCRYGFIEKVVSGAVVRKDNGQATSGKIDRIVANKYLAIPIFLLVMFCVFFHIWTGWHIHAGLCKCIY